MGSLSLGILLGLLAAPEAEVCPTPAAETQLLRASPKRSPLLVLINQPAGQHPIVNPKGIEAALARALEPQTDLSVETRDPELLTSCSAQLSCVVEKVAPSSRSRLLLLITSIPSGNSDFIFSMLIDLVAATDVLHLEDDPETREARILAAVRAQTDRTEIRSPKDLDTYFERSLKRTFKQVLVKTDHWRPFGSVVVDLPDPSFVVSVDGKVAGTSTASRVVVCPVRRGTRHVRLEHSEYDPFEAHLEVKPNAFAELQPDLSVKTGAILRTGVFYTGLVLSAAGAAAISIAMASSSSDTSPFCSGPNGSCPEGGAFTSEGGLLLGPLGYSVAATGILWALSPTLSDETDLPLWLWLVVGAATGAASYGLSAALNPH